MKSLTYLTFIEIDYYTIGVGIQVVKLIQNQKCFKYSDINELIIIVAMLTIIFLIFYHINDPKCCKSLIFI